MKHSAYLINPKESTILTVEVTKDAVKEIQQRIDAELFDIVRFDKTRDVCFVSDMGWYDGSWEKHGMFFIGDYPTTLAGLGLIMGDDGEGGSAAPSRPMEEYSIRFVDPKGKENE